MRSILLFLRQLEYAACSFYCRQWLLSREENGKDHSTTLFFEALFADEFFHLFYFNKLIPELPPCTDREAFIKQQEKTLINSSKEVGSSRNYLTSPTKDSWGGSMIGIGSKFLVFKVLLGKKFTKDLSWENKIALVTVADESNHLLYKVLDLVDKTRNYYPLYQHPNKVEYPSPKSLLFFWVLKYIMALTLFLPLDLLRILYYRRK